jgi:diguanylate cyclase (GGDEF)-like protein/PAS domain S-box-containing protein
VRNPVTWSVRVLLSILTAAAVIPASVLLAFSVHHQYQSDERDAAQSAHNLAQLTADNVQTFLSDTKQVLGKIAGRLQAADGSTSLCDPIFGQFQDLYPQFSNLSQSEPGGSIICSTMRQPGNSRTFVGNAAWFTQVYATRKFTVGPPYLGPVSQRVVSVLSQPLFGAGGKMTGSIQMPIDLAKFRVIPGADKLPESTVISIVDARGVLVARSRNAEQFVGKNLSQVAAVKLLLQQKQGTGRSTTSEGIERVFGFVAIPGTDWFAVAGISTESVLQNARQSVWRNLVFGGLTLLLILGMAVYLSKRIAAPMAAVRETARQAAAGDLNARVPVAGPAEIADFAIQFNRMLDSIRASQGELADAQSELVLLGTCVSHLTDMVIIMDARNTVLGWPVISFVNQAFVDITGFTRGMALGRPTTFLHGPDTDPAAIANIGAGIAAAEPFRQELVNYTHAGAPLWIELDMIPIRAAGGALTHWVSIERNVTVRKLAEQNIQRLAYSDGLTGLPNRSLLMDRIDAALVQACSDGMLGALLFVDLDNFKQINDARGHAVGDALLQVVAQRLASVVSPCATVARLGGDEFVILLTALSTDLGVAARTGMALAESVRGVLAHPCDVDGQRYHSGASIGVALLRCEEQSAHDLLREADTAMYCAKRGGRNRVALFEPIMQTEVEIRLALEHDLAQAVAHKQLSVHVQTQVDRHGQPAGAEFLMRWRHPVRGFVPPCEFVPIAEDTGMIVDMGTWMLKQACLTLAHLREAGHTLPLSINVSPRQFRQADFVKRVKRMLSETGALPSQLIFEVTEGLLIDDLDETVDRMSELVALGIRFSIDDFGTGYSSLAYLHRLPLHELKIDRSFMQDTPKNMNNTAIVKMILSMARHLGLRVVAEGVETREQADFLVANDCDLMQGYLYCRPVPLEQWQQSLASQAA